MQDPKNFDLGTIPQLCWSISLRLRHVSTIGKKNSSNISSRCPHNIVNFGLLAAEVCWRVWGTPANFNGFRVLATLLHGTLLLGVSQTLRRWTEGATYIRQGGHHVGHLPTYLVMTMFWPPRRVLGGIYHCSQFGWNWCNSFDNMQVLIFCKLSLKIPIQAPKMEVFRAFLRKKVTTQCKV